MVFVLSSLFRPVSVCVYPLTVIIYFFILNKFLLRFISSYYFFYFNKNKKGYKRGELYIST